MIATSPPVTRVANPSFAPLFAFKYPPSSASPPVVHSRIIYRPKPMSALPISPSPSPGRAASSSACSSPTSGPSLKRKGDSDTLLVPPKPTKRPSIKSDAIPKKHLPRAESVPNATRKKSRPARHQSRPKTEELVDIKYTPPPKRVRSDSTEPFGRMDTAIPRPCYSHHDGRVEQHSSKDVIDKLLPTYKSYFHNPNDATDKSWEIQGNHYPVVVLEYPNHGARETFPLLVPKDPQHYSPLMELSETLEVIIKYYIHPSLQSLFGTLSESAVAATLKEPSPPIGDNSLDLLQTLRRAEHRCDGPLYRETFERINDLICGIKAGVQYSDRLSPSTASSPSSSDGSTALTPLTSSSSEFATPPPTTPSDLSANAAIEAFPPVVNPLHEVVRTWDGVPVGVWKTILSETYQRCVGPSVPSLKEYTPHSSETYGELEAQFVSDIVHHCKITPQTNFMDLGSGVGNIALQLSLQAGCETYGIEIRHGLDELAKKQRAELEKRCRMWGVTANKVELHQGDFRDHEETRNRLKTAEVVLVNNFKFGPDLNAALANMFLDLQDGAIVVTLMPMLPENFRISIHTMSNPLAIFQQEEREFPKGSVSWSNVGGKYFVNRINREPLRLFAEENQQVIREVSRRTVYKPATQRRGKRNP